MFVKIIKLEFFSSSGPKSQIGHCDTSAGYAWTDWQDDDDGADGFGDWEYKNVQSGVCSNPVALKAATVWGNPFNEITHIDLELGFWCLSEENNDIGCEDYKISWCCPELHDGEQSWKNLNSYFLTNSKSFFF